MLYILRHGETEWNIQKKRQGQKNSPLTEKGIKQAKNMAKTIKELENNLGDFEIIVSPLGRTLQTAEIIKDELSLNKDLIVEDLLIEISFGDFEGLTKEDVEKHYPDETKKRASNPWFYAFPNGESFTDVENRIKDFFKKYDRTKNYIIISHNGVSKVIRGILANIDHKRILDTSNLHDQNTIYSWDGEKMLLHKCDTK